MTATPTRGEVTPALQQDLHELYRHLHAHPELSMVEHETAELITDRLDRLGFDTFRCGGTGVVGTMRRGDGAVVGFRADIDGLPVAEQTGLDYASQAQGTPQGGDTALPVMHACGHDVHITCGIGVATLLADPDATWSGTAVLLFQPGEETGQGAAAMVADGLWDRAPKPEIIYCQHVGTARAGEIEIISGPAMAMADSWRVTVHGRGGHGSQPDKTIDPILLAAHMVVRIQSIVAREVPPQRPAVVTVATFHAGLKENIIPSEAEFTLNVRSLDTDVRDRVLTALRRVILAEAAASGAPEPTIEEMYTFPLLRNDPDATAALHQTLNTALGPENVHTVEPRMGSEDFGILPDAIDVPGVYWFLGGLPSEMLDGAGPVPTNHSPLFAPTIEPTITTGVRAAYAAITSRLGA